MTAQLSPTDILSRLRQRLPRFAAQLDPATRLENLGLDSMDTVELLCAIHEEFHVRITENEFRPGLSLGDLAEAIAHKTPSS